MKLTHKRYQDPVLRLWLEMFSPLTGTNLKQHLSFGSIPPHPRVLPYMGYRMSWTKCSEFPTHIYITFVQLQSRYCFSANLVINRVSILADFGHFDMGMFLRRSHFHHYQKENQQKPFTNYVYCNLTLIWTRELIIM